jgi:alkanesulfonate monooxygenase SsuD/methylene tetrahydromethanopterin reductase-like flavin-dependent oxidoreductase (luciferase family)
MLTKWQLAGYSVHLLVSLAAHGWHPAAWRVSGSAGFAGVVPFRAMMRTVEQAGLDAVLLGLPVAPAAGPAGGRGDTLHLDPLPLLGALIGAGERIGLCAYWPCDIAEPYHVARVFATLDHLAGGRVGWIAGLAGPQALARRFQRLAVPTSEPEASARMVELVEVARQLWDSWEDGSFVVDQATGTFVDPQKVHPINHEGRFFTVRGPLNVPRPVQGQPVILYRDRPSDEARAAMAASVEIVLADCATVSEAKARRGEWRALAEQHGRAPDALRLIVHVMPILAETEEAAAERAAALDGLLLHTQTDVSPLRFVGTPQSFATWMARWHEDQACDGFDLQPAVSTTDLDLIAREVVPALNHLGIRQTEIQGSTLRKRLGLRVPASRFAS